MTAPLTGGFGNAVRNSPAAQGGGFTGTDFWTQFLTILEGGTLTSDPSYYLPNASGAGITAQPGEWANVIVKTFERTAPGSEERKQLVSLLDQAGFWTDNDDRQFWIDQPLNALDNQDLINAAELRFPTMFDEGGLPTGVGGGPAATSGPDDEFPAETPVGQVPGGEDDATTVPGILSGGRLTRVERGTPGAGEDDLWAMVYMVGNIEHVYTFASFEAMEQTLGPNAVANPLYNFQSWDSSTDLNDSDTWLLGAAEGFSGQTGNYGTYFNNIQQEAALEAGIRDPGKMGEYFSDPDIQRIIAEGEAGGWSATRIQAEIRNTNYYQNVMYPGISTILNRNASRADSASSPEREWKKYLSDVDSSLEALGYARDADGTFATTVGDMLGRNIKSENFVTFAPVFIRAEASQDFAGNLNEWLERDTGKTLTFEDWFSVHDGTTNQELAEVVEKATIGFQAQQSGTLLSPETITRLANETQLSEDQISVAFSNAEEALLSIGPAELNRFGLSENALVSSAFGLEAVGGDPLSTDGTPFTAVEVQRRARKAARELAIQDDPKAKFFVGFDQFGRPQRQGLSATAPETG